MSDNEQSRVATVQLTNDAWTDEIQRLIGLLEREFFVNAQMADGKMHLIRESCGSRSSSDTQNGGSMSLRSRQEHAKRLTERMREKAQGYRDTDESAEDVLAEQEDTHEADDAEEDKTEDGQPVCQYCGDSFDPRGIDRHEQNCNENPANAAKEKESTDETTCEYCGETFAERGLGPHQRHCDENPANTPEDNEDDGQEDDSATDEPDAAGDTDDTDGGSLPSGKPEAIQKAMENPDDLPEEPVPVGVAIQYNAGSYTCKSCDTCLATDQELTDHVNDTGHRGAYQVNRGRCQ